MGRDIFRDHILYVSNKHKINSPDSFRAVLLCPFYRTVLIFVCWGSGERVLIRVC